MSVARLRWSSVTLWLALLGVVPLEGEALPPAQRVVSLAPSLTETVFAVGAGDRLVGVSVYCDYPPEVEKVDRVGTFLTPNIEAIVAKRPDLVLAVPSPANQNPVESLRRLGMRVAVFDPQSVGEILASIREIGDLLDRRAAALRVVRDIERQMSAVRTRLAGAPSRSVLMVVGQTPLIAAGAGSFPDELIRLSHGVNLGARGGAGWPHLSLEFVLAAAPDVIIDTTFAHDEPSTAAAGLEFWRAFPSLPAVREGRVHGHRQFQLLRPGPRIGRALRSVARFVHPERFVGVPAEPTRSDTRGERPHDTP